MGGFRLWGVATVRLKGIYMANEYYLAKFVPGGRFDMTSWHCRVCSAADTIVREMTGGIDANAGARRPKRRGP